MIRKRQISWLSCDTTYLTKLNDIALFNIKHYDPRSNRQHRLETNFCLSSFELERRKVIKAARVMRQEIIEEGTKVYEESSYVQAK